MRVILILPLLWTLVAGIALAGSQKTRKAKQHVPRGPGVESRVAWLATPEKSIEVFRLLEAERPEWLYMVVRADEDGSRTMYGDEQTVGRVLQDLAKQFRDMPILSGRCPAASSGWRFEKGAMRVSYCSENTATERIERAASMLEINPLDTN